jgi:hypothetical protein
MAIYTTDTYEILSIMKSFETDTQSGVVTFDQGGLHIQGLPTSNYAHIVPIGIRKTHGLVEEDYDNYDRFVANVIPILESSYIAAALNINSNISYTFANSAISPISMYSDSAQT